MFGLIMAIDEITRPAAGITYDNNQGLCKIFAGNKPEFSFNLFISFSSLRFDANVCITYVISHLDLPGTIAFEFFTNLKNPRKPGLLDYF